MRSLVHIGKEGRITLPAQARRGLGLEEGAEAIVEVIEGRITITPAVVMSREDAWAYTREHRARLAHAQTDAAAGRKIRVSKDQLESLLTAQKPPVPINLQFILQEGQDLELTDVIMSAAPEDAAEPATAVEPVNSTEREELV